MLVLVFLEQKVTSGRFETGLVHEYRWEHCSTEPWYFEIYTWGLYMSTGGSIARPTYTADMFWAFSRHSLRVVVAMVLYVPWSWEFVAGGVHEPVGSWLEDFDYPVWTFPSLVECPGCRVLHTLPYPS